jgi:hypothetical protein
LLRTVPPVTNVTLVKIPVKLDQRKVELVTNTESYSPSVAKFKGFNELLRYPVPVSKAFWCLSAVWELAGRESNAKKIYIKKIQTETAVKA